MLPSPPRFDVLGALLLALLLDAADGLLPAFVEGVDMWAAGCDVLAGDECVTLGRAGVVWRVVVAGCLTGVLGVVLAGCLTGVLLVEEELVEEELVEEVLVEGTVGEELVGAGV